VIVRFVVDAQLPPLLARHLVSLGHDAEHVEAIGLASAPDREIWAYAQANNAVLVTKDEDFITMRAFRAEGPSVLWVRIGNTTRRDLLNRIFAVWPDVIAALQRGETVVEISSESND
jgi:predicted nuclease of predicted toxin-antitoxin system